MPEAQAPAKPDSAPQKEGDEANEEGETTLVPRSMLGDKKPGDKCTFEVVRTFDDEVELKYSDSESESNSNDGASYKDEIMSMNNK